MPAACTVYRMGGPSLHFTLALSMHGASGIQTPDLPLSRRTPKLLGQRGGRLLSLFLGCSVNVPTAWVDLHFTPLWLCPCTAGRSPPSTPSTVFCLLLFQLASSFAVSSCHLLLWQTCSDKFTWWHVETEATDQTCYLT